MSNQIFAPYLNPVRFVLQEPANIPQYVSKFMDDWIFENTIRDFETPATFRQKWLIDDSIKLQYTSNFSPLTLKLYDCTGKLIYSSVFDTKQQDFFNPGFYIRQIDFPLSAFDPGIYYFVIPEMSWVSDPFEILEEFKNSNYIEYSHSETYGDINFDIPFSPTIRTPSILKYKTPGSRDVIYPDSEESETLLHSVPFRLWRYILGGQGAVPPWFIDKIARIFGCDSLKIDGRLYTKSEGANWEPVELDDYPMAGWSIELREKLNRDSLIFENDTQIIGMNSMMAVIDSKGFGMDDDGGNFLQIENVE